MRLKTVVFPAPLGPMIPVISFSRWSMEKSATAATPPKFFETPVTFRTSAVIPRSSSRR
jgi:hypothetical protein